MKNWLRIGALSVGAASLIWVGLVSQQDAKYHAAKPLNNPEGKNMMGIKGAVDYIHSVKSDPLTGEIDQDLVLKAIEQADDLRNQGTSVAGSAIQFTNPGPDNIGGRTRAILIDARNPNVMYAGGVSGGLFISTTGGTSWSPVDDRLDNLIICSITQGLDGTIYFGTGESFARGIDGTGNSGFRGNGIWKSANNQIGVKAFNQLASTNNSGYYFVNRLATHPITGDIYAATNGGIRVSSDGGITWSNPVNTNSKNASSQDIKIGNNGKIVASAGQRLHVSDDGVNWTDMTGTEANRKVPSSARIEVALSYEDPQFMYAVTIAGGNMLGAVYQSKDGGANWDVIAKGNATFNPLGNQGDYDILLGVTKGDPQKIFLGGQVELFTWTPSAGWSLVGYANFGQGSPYYIHADMHGYVNHPTDPNIVYMTTDGGIFRSSNAMNPRPTIKEMNIGYRTTQYYSIWPSRRGHIVGGAQDNGTALITGQNLDPSDADRILGGDGMYCAFSLINPDIIFASSQSGAMARSQNLGQGFNSFLDSKADANTDNALDGSSFYTNFRLWEDLSDSTSLMAAGGTRLWITPGALTFSKLPEWFPFGTSAGSVGVQEFSGDGDALFYTKGSLLYRITGLQTALKNDKLKYDSAGNWSITGTGIEASTTPIHNASNQTITGIGVDPNDGNRVVITIGHYNTSPHVYLSENALSATPTFVSIHPTGLPRMPFYDALINQRDPNHIVVGTELGVFQTFNKGVSWEEVLGFPRVPVFMLVQQPWHPEAKNFGYVYAATHGRGFWVSDAGEFVGIERNKPLTKPLHLTVAPNPIKNVARVSLNAPAGTYGIRLMDLSGKVVKEFDPMKSTGTGTSLDIQLSDVRSGVYLVHVYNGSRSVTERVLIRN